MRALLGMLRPLGAEFAANARLRFGVWLILGILLAYGIMVQSDRLAAVHADYAAELARLAKAEQVLAGEDWPALLEAERETHRGLQSKFWEAETEGLAQAKLQDALSGVVEGLGLVQPLFRSGASQPAPGLPGIWRVQTRLDAPFQSGGELRALHALATHPQKLVVDQLHIRRRNRDSYIILMISAYFMGVEAGQ